MPYSVPFEFDDVRRHPSGRFMVVHTTGVVRLDPAALVIEFRESVRVMGTFEVQEMEPRQVRAPLDRVAAVTLRRRWFRQPVLVIETTTLDVFQDFPYGEGVRRVVPVARRDALHAAELAVEVEHRLADLRLLSLEAGGR